MQRVILLNQTKLWEWRFACNRCNDEWWPHTGVLFKVAVWKQSTNCELLRDAQDEMKVSLCLQHVWLSEHAMKLEFGPCCAERNDVADPAAICFHNLGVVMELFWCAGAAGCGCTLVFVIACNSVSGFMEVFPVCSWVSVFMHSCVCVSHKGRCQWDNVDVNKGASETVLT